MHTSKVLRSWDFQYWRLEEDGPVREDFSALWPNYHELDRVGVVSPSLEDGVLGAGYALLALATAFYDVQRSRPDDFFTYAQHFALIGASEGGVLTQGGPMALDNAMPGASWGVLDVWPESNWHPAPRTVAGMLRKVFDLQISRLFWPEAFQPGGDEPRLPFPRPALLKSRLKAVTYYNAAVPNVEIRATGKAADFVRKGIAGLPTVDGSPRGADSPRELVEPADPAFPNAQRYRQVSVDAFLEELDPCLEWVKPTAAR